MLSTQSTAETIVNVPLHTSEGTDILKKEEYMVCIVWTMYL